MCSGGREEPGAEHVWPEARASAATSSRRLAASHGSHQARGSVAAPTVPQFPRTAVVFAYESGDLSTLALLLDRGANVDFEFVVSRWCAAGCCGQRCKVPENCLPRTVAAEAHHVLSWQTHSARGSPACKAARSCQSWHAPCFSRHDAAATVPMKHRPASRSLDGRRLQCALDCSIAPERGVAAAS